MTEEFYINGQLVDTEDVEIVRTYKTPFFSDVTQLKNDGTLSIKLPKTARNTAVFEACFRTDFLSDLPYDFLYADYYFNGLPIFLNAEVRILNVDEFIEIQCVYGVNREMLLPLFESKLNEITVNGTTVTSDNWIINWHNPSMYASGKKYEYPFYFSGLRTRDVETNADTIQYTLQPDATIQADMKYMTEHPFISIANIFSLINGYNSLSIDFSDIESKLSDYGLILSGNKVNSDIFTEGHIDIFNTDTALPDVLFTSIDSATGFPFIVYQNSLRIDKYAFGEITPIKIRLTADFKLNRQYGVTIFKTKNGTETAIDSFNYDSDIGIVDGYYTYNEVKEIILTNEDVDSYITFECSGGVSPYIFKAGYTNIIKCLTLELNGCYYSISNDGYYDCLANLPAITQVDFLQQMLILSGLSLGYDSSGNLKTYSLDNFKDNIDNGDVIDWSGKVSSIRKGTFQFNSNAQKNYIKFSNDKDFVDKKLTILVNDKTIETERDLYVLQFDRPYGDADDYCNFTLYEQTVKRSGDTGVSFENKYVGDKWQNGICQKAEIQGSSPTAYRLINKDLVSSYYDINGKLVERPLVVECDVNLSLYESAQIDFEMPIYCDEIGRYCLLLELQAPKYDVCVAKLLVVNQKL